MCPQRQKTKFGILLEEYLNDRECSKAELERLLNLNGYHIANGLVSKYQYGTIKPNPEFIVWVALVLALSQDETIALVELHLSDMTSNFLSDFYVAWKNWVG